jgi:hypothetical protein
MMGMGTQKQKMSCYDCSTGVARALLQVRAAVPKAAALYARIAII